MDIELTDERDGSRRTGRGRLLAGGLPVVALLAVLLAVGAVAAIATSSPPTDYPRHTPEGTFQRYLAAWDAGDVDGAHSYFSSRVTAEMSLSEYRRMSSDWGWQRDEERRVVLDQVERQDQRATLHLRIETFSGGLTGGRHAYTIAVGLVEEDGVWHIDEALAGLDHIGLHY
jgi:hypothetical protein